MSLALAASADPVSGAELARLTRRRVLRAALVSNGLGGVAVFIFGLLAPGSPSPEDGARLALANGVTLLLFLFVGFPLGIRAGARAAST